MRKATGISTSIQRLGPTTTCFSAGCAANASADSASCSRPRRAPSSSRARVARLEISRVSWRSPHRSPTHGGERGGRARSPAELGPVSGEESLRLWGRPMGSTAGRQLPIPGRGWRPHVSRGSSRCELGQECHGVVSDRSRCSRGLGPRSIAAAGAGRKAFEAPLSVTSTQAGRRHGRCIGCQRFGRAATVHSHQASRHAKEGRKGNQDAVRGERS